MRAWNVSVEVFIAQLIVLLSDFCKYDVRFVPGGAGQLASSTAHGWAIQVTTPRINVGSYVAPPAVNQIYFIEAGLELVVQYLSTLSPCSSRINRFYIAPQPTLKFASTDFSAPKYQTLRAHFIVIFYETWLIIGKLSKTTSRTVDGCGCQHYPAHTAFYKTR